MIARTKKSKLCYTIKYGSDDMKIVKRDGRIVDYDSNKIRIAIGKANNEVSEEKRINSKDIDKIISYIEKLNKKRMLVEDIQDIIEQKLMEFKKYELAKKYIIYRYTRSIIRKANTTDANILSLLKNGNYKEEGYLIANRQRDLMAGEASKDLAYRLLLPKNVVTNELNGFIKFCNVEYFTEPIIDNCYINIKEMLEKGTFINGIKIDKPKNFQSLCNVIIEIISSIASLQTGDIYINISDLFDYYDTTFNKKLSVYDSILREHIDKNSVEAIAKNQTFTEIRSGIQTIFYQINTIMTSNGLVPKVHFIIDTNEIKNDAQEFIVYEIIKQKLEGIIDENNETVVPTYPKIIYSLNKENSDNNKYSFITDELVNLKNGFLIMNEKVFKKYTNNIKKFNQGSICISLPKIAIESKNTNTDFWQLLDEKLDCCYEGLICKNHNLCGVFAGKSPIHWSYGAISKLNKEEKIDELLKKDHSKLTLSLIGMDALDKITNSSISIELLLEKISKKLELWNSQNNFEIILNNFYSIEIQDYFFKKELDLFKKEKIENLVDKNVDLVNNFYSGFYYIYLDDITNLDSVKEKEVIFYK